MARAYASAVIDATADAVWGGVRDFGDLASWFAPLVVSSAIDDGKAGDQVGAVRTCVLADGVRVQEHLLSHSDVERSCTYSVPDSPLAIEHYRATLRVTPVTVGDQAFVEWWATFDCALDEVEHWEQHFEQQLFQVGFENLGARFGRRAV
ncbi:hypothetical protein DSM104299_03649 [Baekduia alba]|uniref:SRPBCC family protein n=1 Tax=Baekduia alba TaxID=2997333 RepID=UPI002340BFA2|nr:SRPBCC family protein [Baekduia alba]WCB94909.1 hypothetical protein DSM104299_03649 [Baekduia alba]